MFPHMYKVRPGKSQQVSNDDMAADCDWQGDNWRKNSTGNSPGNSSGNRLTNCEGEAKDSATSVFQTPPPIPAPPMDPQDNLSNRESSTSDSGQLGEDNQANSEEKTGFWWEDIEEENEEILSNSPWKRTRSRSRTTSPSTQELRPPTVTLPRTRRVRNTDVNCPSGPPIQSTSPLPIRRRSRNTQNQITENQNSTQATDCTVSRSPPRRRRSREDTNENEPHYHPWRTRSRSRSSITNNEEPEQNRFRRMRSTEVQEEPTDVTSNGQSEEVKNLENPNRTSRVRTRNPVQTEVTNEIEGNNSRRRRRNQTHETTEPADTDNTRGRSRSRSLSMVKNADITPVEKELLPILCQDVSLLIDDALPEPEICKSSLVVELKTLSIQEPNKFFPIEVTNSVIEPDVTTSKNPGSKIENLEIENKNIDEKCKNHEEGRREDQLPDLQEQKLCEDVILNDENIIEDEKSIIEDDKNIIEDDKNIIEDDKNIIEGDKNIIEDDKNIIEDDKNIIEDDKNIIEDNKNIIEDDKNNIEDDKNAIQKQKMEENQCIEDEISSKQIESCKEEQLKTVPSEQEVFDVIEEVIPDNKIIQEENVTNEPKRETMIALDDLPEALANSKIYGISATLEDPEIVAEENFWGVAEGESDYKPLEENLMTIQEEDPQPQEDSIEKATKLWLQTQSNKSMVDVIDSVEDPLAKYVLSPEDLEFDPVEALLAAQNERHEPSYDDWGDEEEPEGPEFLNKKLRKVEKTSSSPRYRVNQIRSFSPNLDIEDLDMMKSSTKLKPASVEHVNKSQKESEGGTLSIPPPPPPPPLKSSQGGGPPPPPPPPPPPGAIHPKSGPLSEKEERIKQKREKMLEQIRKASRTRPDWHTVMKDIEGGIKLRRLNSQEKSDRSKPILPETRELGGKFVYDSEKPMKYNKIMKDIHRGVKLRHVRTDDRSKPDFNKLGLRKLRRQVTREEKKKEEGVVAEDVLPSSSDEEEDIDTMRDDLQSTKTQLADEMKKNRKVETENKILNIDIASLQAEVKRMKRRLKESGIHEAKPLDSGQTDALAPKLSKSMSKLRMREEDLDFSELDTIEEDIKTLNDQIEAQRKRADKSEQAVAELSAKLSLADNSVDEWESRSIYFEKKFKSLQKDQGIELPDINCIGTQTEDVIIQENLHALPTKKSVSRKSFGVLNRMQSFQEEAEQDSSESSSSEDEESTEDQEEEEVDKHEETQRDNDGEAERQAENETIKRERELKMWQNRINHTKEKTKNVRRERSNLRDRIYKYYKDMRTERTEYLKVKAELKELADQMKEMTDDEQDDYSTDDSNEDSTEEVAEESPEDRPEWWSNEKPMKPKKLKKRRKKKILQEENDQEVDTRDEEPNDLEDIPLPTWPESDGDESEPENEDEDVLSKIKRCKKENERIEAAMNEKKKENYLYKAQIDQCDEMYQEERRRHARLNNEMHMLISSV